MLVEHGGPGSVRVETFAAHARGSSAAELLDAVPGGPGLVLMDPKKELRSFRLALTTTMGGKRGRGRGAFIDSVLTATDTFHADVLQYLKAWSAAPPKLCQPSTQPPEVEPTMPSSLRSTDYSSQDGAEHSYVGAERRRGLSPLRLVRRGNPRNRVPRVGRQGRGLRRDKMCW